MSARRTEPADAGRRRLGGDTLAALRRELTPMLDDIAAELTELYRARIPVYERFDPVMVRANTRLVLGMVTDQLGDDTRRLTTDGLTTLAHAMAEQGIPLEPVAVSVHLGARRIAGILRDRADELGLSPADLGMVQDLAWGWATEGAAAIHSVQQALAVAGATRRADFLRELLAGQVTPAALLADAPAHGLSAGSRYHVACARVVRDRSGSELVTALRVRGSTSDRPVVDAVVDGVHVALMPQRPARIPAGIAVGVGPAVDLRDAGESFRCARRALQIARRHGRHGLIDLPDLGALVLVDHHDDALRSLDLRHLEPLRARGVSGTVLLDTARTYLAHDRRIDATAAELTLHRNTVRYRLRQFAELTALDLDRTDHLVLAWCLLHRDHTTDDHTTDHAATDQHAADDHAGGGATGPAGA